jgi:hypothetical protein
MHTTARYQELRKQIAELGLRFHRAATQFPSTYFEIVESNSSLATEVWTLWISENRTPEELQHQHWDIYPPGWAVDVQKVLEWVIDCEPILQDRSGNSLETTKHCGVLHGISSTIGAAQRELESLSKTGLQILLAIRQEVRQSESLQEFATLSILADGHRGWLDLVRQTAEVNRGANLKVEYGIFNIAVDPRSQFFAIRKSMAEKRDNTIRGRNPADSHVCRVSPDIFSASANAIGIWLQGIQEEPIVSLVCPGLTIPRILSPDATDEALELLHGLNLRRDQSVPTPPVQKAKRKVGRPKLDKATRELDRRIFDASKSCNDRQELSTRFNLPVEEINKRIDRVRKSINRRKTK